MIDFFMKLMGYENINNIKIPSKYKVPGAEKLKCKMCFYQTTGEFQDKIILNNENLLLDGYITFKICKWIGIKYVKVTRIDVQPELYFYSFRRYRLRTKEKRKNTNKKELGV